MTANAARIRAAARRCRGRHERAFREELHALAAEIERQDAEVEALRLRHDFEFALIFAQFLNDESSGHLHHLAAELLADCGPDRAVAIARAADGLTPTDLRYESLHDHFNALARRIGGAK